MAYKLKETRAKYNITQQELSDLTDIPKRTIENWESGKRNPSPWVEKLVTSYIKKYPKNSQGIVTEKLGIYELNDIKNTVIPLTLRYDIDKIILFGSYAKGQADPLSDIDMAIDGHFKGLTFFGLLEELNELFVKDIDLIYIKEVDEASDILKEINKGIVLYERT